MPQRKIRRRKPPRRTELKDIITKSAKEAYKIVNLSSKDWFSNMWFALAGAIIALYIENIYADVKQLNFFWFGVFFLLLYFVYLFLSFVGLTLSNIIKEYQNQRRRSSGF